MKTLARSLRDVEPQLAELQSQLNYAFRDPALLVAAVSHPSFSIEQSQPLPDNQRLEFLGDAVWGQLLTEKLFREFPDKPEGELTRLRSILSRGQACVGYARELGLDQCLLLGRGEERGGGRQRPSNLEDAFEAVIGAVYLDGGWEPLRPLCDRLTASHLAAAAEILAAENPKGELQEAVQNSGGGQPRYETLAISGPDHQPEISVRVLVGNDILGEGTARSRREAERQAAQAALEKLRRQADKPAPESGS